MNQQQLDMNQIISLVSSVASAFSLVTAIIALWYASMNNRLTDQNAKRESSDIIFQEWLGVEMHGIRRYFFSEFVPKYRERVISNSFSDIETLVPEDDGRTWKLCFFFDKLGWLGSAGLIDIDYVMGPMQHVMRHTWFAVEPLIRKERENQQRKKIFDPVFLNGFEWLFLRTCQKNKDQASLLSKLFSKPNLRSKKDIVFLKSQYVNFENEYRKKLTSDFIDAGKNTANNENESLRGESEIW